MTVSVGQMRDRVTIERSVPDTDDAGGYNPQWVAVAGAANISAMVEGQSGSELVIGDKLESVVSHIVTIRYVQWIHSSMRISWDNAGYIRFLKIVSVIEDTHRRFLTIRCAEYEDDNVGNAIGG